MQDRDLIISQIRQRLEILYQMIEELETGGGGEPGTSNYNDLSNKPSINNITLTGNKTTTQLGLASAAQITQTNTNVANLSAEIDAKVNTSSVIPEIMAANDDINDYRIAESLTENSGFKRWICPSSAVRNSLVNLPSDFPSYPDFQITFEQFKTGGIGMQTITGGSTSSMYIAKRFYKNNAFSAWYKVSIDPIT